MHMEPLETIDDLPAKSELWERLIAEGLMREEGENAPSEEDLAWTLYIDKMRVIQALAVMQVGVICRAYLCCQKYFDWMKRKNDTDSKTYLRPRVRIDERYKTVEMAWVRRMSKSWPSKPGEQFKAQGKIGRTFQIKTDNGPMTVFIWYDYIKRGVKDRYSNIIFKHEPAWAQKIGIEVEDQFERLRKEQKMIGKIRQSLLIEHRHQIGLYSEKVQDMLDELEAIPLKSLYCPDFNLKDKI